MIKLKSILKESYAWQRKAGEPLPTMKSVQEKHQRNLKEQEEAGEFGDGDFSTKVPYRAIWNELNSAVPGGKNQKVNYAGSGGQDVESMQTKWTGPNAEWIAELDPYQDKKYAALTVSIKQNNPEAQATFDHMMQRFMQNGKPADPELGYIAYKWIISPMTMDGSNASVEGAIRILKYVQSAVKPMQENYQRNLKEQDLGNELDVVAGNPGKEVPVKGDALQIYDVNGNLMPKQYVPAGLEKRVQTTPDMKLHTKYYFATRPGRVDGTSLAVYDRVTGELRDNDTKELLVTLQKDMPAREIYLWLRRNYLGKRNVKFEAYDAKGVEEAKDKKDKKSKDKKPKRWQDDDGDGNWYEKEDVSEGAMCEACGSQDCECGSDTTDESVLNMRESFWGRVKGNLHGHEYILREAFRK
jgi:hypothetical protein